MPRAARLVLLALLAAAGIAAARRLTAEPAPRMRGTWTPL